MVGDSVELAQVQLKKALENKKYKSLTGKVQARLKESSSCGGVDKVLLLLFFLLLFLDIYVFFFFLNLVGLE